MKAEHRKELQTNTLADFLGKTVRNVRSGGGPSWIKIGIVFVVLLVSLVGWMVWKNWGSADAEAWLRLQLNDDKSLEFLTQEQGNRPAGQAARFTRGYDALWQAVTYLKMAKPADVQRQLEGVRGHFAFLAEECKDDPERLAEARYHIAVATETLAAFDIKSLADAKQAFSAATEEGLSSTAYGMMAKKRLEQYANDLTTIEKFYREFRAGSRFGIGP